MGPFIKDVIRRWGGFFKVWTKRTSSKLYNFRGKFSGKLTSPYQWTCSTKTLFELERSDGSSTLSAASAQVKNELIELWYCAGYGDILKDRCNIIKEIKAL